MPKIDELIENHYGEWLAIEVTEEEDGTPTQGTLIHHSPERKDVWEKTKDRKRLYITYAGPSLKEDYAAAFGLGRIQNEIRS